MILALDQGTTSSRAILFDEAGEIRALAQKEFRQFYPQPGWVEHDPMEIWRTQSETASHAIGNEQVDAIGITNQRETTVVWDRATGEPIYPAIVWQDRRTAAECDLLKAEGRAEWIAAKTGLIPDAYFSATKLRWLLDRVPGARAKAERGELAFGTIDTWLIWKLTEGVRHVTDPTNASRTLLFDLHRQAWDDELLKLFDIPRSILPEVLPSAGDFGETKLFGKAIPIRGVAGDQQAALFGQQCLSPGMAKNTYGTGCFLLMHTGETPVRSQNQLLTTAAISLGDSPAYALEGSVFIAGAAIGWLRDGLKLIQTAEEIDPLARSVPDNGGVYFVPAFAGLGAPHWDPHARGLIHGLTRGTTAGHLARATLEAIAYQTADVLRAMEKDSGIELTQLRADGGAARCDFLLQFQANLLGVPVVRPHVTETTALGAAQLAGLPPGTWKAERRFEPSMAASQREALLAGWREALRRTRSES
jgi:glycerol kinase